MPDIVRAYLYLLVSGWKVFVRKETADSWLSRFDGNGVEEVDIGRAERAARWTNTVARYPFPWARCLQRSLALSMWMDDSGLKPVLKLGVRKSASGIDAHSWVEYQGEILNDSEFINTEFKAFSTGGASGGAATSPRSTDRD